jgi:two-component system, NarL family, response regulator DevR
VEKKIGVLLLCQNRLARESIARILEKKTDIQVVAARPVTPTSKQEIAESNADVVVLDSLQLLLEDEIHISKQSSEERTIRCVLVAMADEPKNFLRAIRRGAIGYVLQDASASDVVAAIRAVGRGEAICPPQYTRVLFDYVAAQASGFPNSRTRSSTGLTSREQQLIPLIERGLTNKQIAAHLNLSEQTVKNHVHRILGKLGIGDRLDVSGVCQTELLGM